MSLNSKPPIFVLGCQRSGTSVLRRIINSHSNIACPPESGFLVQLSRVYEIERSIKCLETMGFSKEYVLNQMRLFAAHFFEKYMNSKGKQRWADKTPHYLNHLDTIERIFQGNVVYVGIVRHGLDVAFSLCDFDWGVLKPYLADGASKAEASVRFWKDQNTKLLNFRDKVESKFYLIKYEDLTTSPEAVLPRLFDFLEEPWEESVLKYNEFEHDPGFEDKKVSMYNKIVPNSGNYRKWPLEMQKHLYEESLPLNRQLGYTL